MTSKQSVKITCTGSGVLPLEDIKEFQGNLKTLAKEDFEKLKGQILKLGFTAPIFVWTDKNVHYALDGHQRLKTLKVMASEGHLVPSLPIVDVQAKSKKEAKQKLLAITSSYGKMENEGLFDFLKEADLDIDVLDDLRFPEIDVKELLKQFDLDGAPGGNTDEDDVPETADNEMGVKLGDVWQLGEHRIMCGDSTDKVTVDTLMNGEKADMVFTDPPYGVSYDGGHNEKKRAGIKNDTLSGQDLTNLFGDSLSVAIPFCNTHSAFYIWYSDRKAVETFKSFANLPLKIRAVICWYKVRSGLGAFMSQYIPNYEPCIYAFIDGKSTQWFGPTDEKTVWELKKESKNEFHPTQKPVELPVRAVMNSSKSGQIILDIFLGSGSTLIACEKTGRKCYGMELDPHYCSVVIKRWQDFSGKAAKKL